MTVENMSKSEKIDRAMYLVSVVEEKALDFAEARRRFIRARQPDVEYGPLKAAGDRCIETRRDLRDFLCTVIEGQVD